MRLGKDRRKRRAVGRAIMRGRKEGKLSLWNAKLSSLLSDASDFWDAVF